MPSKCPKCSKGLQLNSIECRACGWRDNQVVAVGVSRDYLRCDWQFNGERCYNLAGSSPVNHTAQTNSPHPGPWYCAGHFSCHDMETGADIIARSKRNGVNDWSPASVLSGKRAHEGRPDDMPSAAQVAANVVQLKSMLTAAALRKPGRGLSISNEPPANAGDAWEPDAA